MTKSTITADEVLARYVRDELPEFIGVDLSSIEAVGPSGSRPLHVACNRSNLEEVKALVLAGANINSVGDMGNTPLHEAVGANNPEIVEFLLLSGADLSIRNEFEQTAKEIAELMERNAVLEVFQRLERT
jgi:uncharacterized protein